MNPGRVSDQVSSSPEASGSSPGSVLRRCREFHGLTLEEASETTKIGITHLKALEEDKIGEFANQAYLKGFLRIYATYLGLNSDDVARMYEKLFGTQGEKPDTQTSLSPTRPPRRLLSLKKLLFPALLLALILITATFFKSSPELPIRQPQQAPPIASLPQKAAIQTLQSSVRVIKTEQDLLQPPPMAERTSAEPPASEKNVTSNRTADAVKGFILKIRVTQNGTLTATVDDSGSQQYELTVGDFIEWKAEKKVALELSNAGGVDVELNGKPYKSLGAAGKPVYVELDADGIKQ